jgi:hypothetical protein
MGSTASPATVVRLRPRTFVMLSAVEASLPDPTSSMNTKLEDNYATFSYLRLNFGIHRGTERR